MFEGVKGLIDCHTHTRFSVDSEADEIKMIERAIDLGLTAYAITDHCEANRWYSKEYYGDVKVYPYFDSGKDYEASVARISELRDKYSGKIKLIVGTELGQAQEFPEIAENVLKDERLDFMIGSLHQLPATEDFALMDYSGFSHDDIVALLDRYFSHIYELCKWGKFDVLGHLTYTLRYIEGENGFKIDMSRYDEQIAESFRLLARKGKGIEINTSGMRQAYGRAFPELKYVKLFKDMGGEILSLGSDAHFVEHLGAHIGRGAEIARQAGFDRVAYFERHKPQFVKL